MASNDLRKMIVRPGGNTQLRNKSGSMTLDNVLEEFAAPPEKIVNLLWCVDKTGSMSALIQKAKSASAEFFRRSNASNIKLNVSWCPYGDYVDYQNYGPSGLIEVRDWTTDVNRLEGFIQETQLVGGGDADEAVEYVMAYALANPAPIDAIILVGDADPHEVQESQRQVRQYGVPTQWQLDWRENAKLLGNKKIPVYTFAMREGCRRVFGEIAQLSGGQMGNLEQLDALIHLLSLTAVAVAGNPADIQTYIEDYSDEMDELTLEYAEQLFLPSS